MAVLPKQYVTAQQLAELPLFEGEVPEQLEWLIPMCFMRQLASGQVLLDPGKFDDRMYVVLQGQLQVQLDDAGSQVLALVGAGQWVGEMSVLEGLPPSAKVVARTSAQLLAIEGPAIRTVLDHSASVARNMLRSLSRRLRKDNLLVGQSILQQRASEANARVDPLTGLYNRRWLDESLRALLEHYNSRGGSLSLLMLDLDRFKQFNDIHGHLAGDRALACFAAVVRDQLRAGDHVARFGGEELVALLPDTQVAEALRIAERVRSSLRVTPITDHDGNPLPHLSVSIGVSAWQEQDTPRKLLDRADSALYAAKAAGRNCVRS